MNTTMIRDGDEDCETTGTVPALDAIDRLMTDLSGQSLADTGAVIDRLLDIRSLLVAAG